LPLAAKWRPVEVQACPLLLLSRTVPLRETVTSLLIDFFATLGLFVMAFPECNVQNAITME